MASLKGCTPPLRPFHQAEASTGTDPLPPQSQVPHHMSAVSGRVVRRAGDGRRAEIRTTFSGKRSAVAAPLDLGPPETATKGVRRRSNGTAQGVNLGNGPAPARRAKGLTRPKGPGSRLPLPFYRDKRIAVRRCDGDETDWPGKSRYGASLSRLSRSSSILPTASPTPRTPFAQSMTSSLT